MQNPELGSQHPEPGSWNPKPGTQNPEPGRVHVCTLGTNMQKGENFGPVFEAGGDKQGLSAG